MLKLKRKLNLSLNCSLSETFLDICSQSHSRPVLQPFERHRTPNILCGDRIRPIHPNPDALEDAIEPELAQSFRERP